jgi:integrase
MFKRYAKALGIDAAPHAARATFVTRLKELGFDDRDVAAAVGHKTEHMVRLYDKRQRDHKISPAKKLRY